MPTLVWEDRMNVGVYLIDEQHKDLVVLINNISKAVDEGANRDVVSKLIRRFFDYTTHHFRSEESLMDHYTYKYYYQQVHEHLDCSLKALEFHRRFAHDNDFDLDEFFAYISTWFIQHTTGIDQTLAEHIRECKANASGPEAAPGG